MTQAEKDRETALALYAPCIPKADVLQQIIDWDCVHEIEKALAEAREEGRQEERAEWERKEAERKEDEYYEAMARDTYPE